MTPARHWGKIMLSRNSGERRSLRRSVIVAQREAIPASLRWVALFVFILFFLPVLPIAAQTNVLTYHNDNARTGQNLNETLLTLSNVNSTNFGKLGFLSVDGLVDAEPLYVANLTVAGSLHNVVFIVTEHDSVYAFDADTFAQLWKVTVLGSGETTSDNRGCGQVTPEIGITSTPVIDLGAGSHGTIFVVAMSKDNFGNYHQRLHALDVTTGAELSGSPTTIQATFPNAAGQVTFDPKQYKERAALLLLNGVIYTTWASHCDHTPYTGWVIGYSESTLQQVSVFNFTPNGSDGSVWMSGAGPAADSLGNIYFLAANGTFDTTLSANGFPVNGDYGNAFIKLSTSGNLSVADYFTMHNTVAESNVDQDLGSGGALVLPDLTDSLGHTLHLAVGAGKDAIIYIVNRDSMGKFNPTSDNIYQEITSNGLNAGVFAMPAYFNGTLYYGAVDSLKAFAIASARLVTPPSSKTASTFAYPGTTPSISANGTANGIVWAVQNSGGTGILHAYDATNLANELYNSNQAGTRDQFSDNKFITPMIANGKVYVGTPTGVVVFGLLSGGTPPPPPSGTVTLQNTNSNLCIDTGGSAGFTALIQSPCSTSNTQKFSLTAAPVSGWYYLVSAASNLCWDVAQGSRSAGALIQQYTCVAVSPEYYQLKAVSSGYEILSANMANGCLDIVGASTAPGAHIEQNTCTGSANQIFNTGAPSNTAPTITTQPGNQTVTAGQTATFTAAATGSPTPTVQWQVSTSGGAFSNVSGATSTTLSFTTASSQNGNQYQAVFTNSAGSATTTAATLTVNSPTLPMITTQPANQIVSAGQTATFMAAATGSPTPTVQWQVSTGGGAFSNVSGATSTSTTLSFTTALSQNGNQYRAVFTNAAGPATTTAATLTVNAAPPPSGTGAAQLITPAPGASGVDPFQAFTWTSVPGAQVYYIYVGTSPGQTDIYNSGQIAPTITSRLVPGLLGAKVYYVTLWTKINNTWYSVPSSFSTASQPLPSDANTFRSAIQQLTGNVRLMTQGATNSPIPGTLLAQVVAEDGVPVASCEQYAEALTRLLAGQRISARMRNTFFDGTNYEAHVIAEYYDPFLDKWIVADATFGVVYWNPGTTSGMSIDDISSAVAAKNWSFIQPFITYTTSNGQLYSHNYYMDPILLFLNPSTTGLQVAQLPLPNSPVPFFTVHADTDIGESGVWLFSFVNQTDMVIISGGGQYGPLVGTIYSKAIALNTGWSITSRPSGMQILTMNRYLYL